MQVIGSIYFAGHDLAAGGSESNCALAESGLGWMVCAELRWLRRAERDCMSARQIEGDAVTSRVGLHPTMPDEAPAIHPETRRRHNRGALPSTR